MNVRDWGPSEGWSVYKGEKVNPNDIVIRNVRQKSAAGWFVGALQFYDREHCECYSKDTFYYPTEELCKFDNPQSISFDDALNRAITFRRI